MDPDEHNILMFDIKTKKLFVQEMDGIDDYSLK